MCIRDRLTLFLVGLRIGLNIIDGNVIDVGYAGVIGADKLCLLYTSDAADDLLCVDLGGRRIIKKKTIKPTNYFT